MKEKQENDLDKFLRAGLCYASVPSKVHAEVPWAASTSTILLTWMHGHTRIPTDSTQRSPLLKLFLIVAQLSLQQQGPGKWSSQKHNELSLFASRSNRLLAYLVLQSYGFLWKAFIFIIPLRKTAAPLGWLRTLTSSALWPRRWYWTGCNVQNSDLAVFAECSSSRTWKAQLLDELCLRKQYPDLPLNKPKALYLEVSRYQFAYSAPRHRT